MRVLAEIPPRPAGGLRAGTLRRGDLAAFERLLGALEGARTVLLVGSPDVRRAIALGLATAATALGRRPALLECDLGEPTLAAELGLSERPGLNECLRTEAEIGQILKPLILAGPGSGAAREPLVCVVAGDPGVDGGALLGSEAFAAALRGLRDAYDPLVLDGPPLEDEAGLSAVAEGADATLACSARGRGAPLVHIPVTGHVVQR